MRLLVLEDHPIIRMGITQLVHARWPECDVVETENLGDALTQLQRGSWSAAVCDLMLPDSSGVESLKKLNKARPDVPILVFSGLEDSSFASRAIQLGAAGYVSKRQGLADVVDALERVLAGKRYISPHFAEQLVDRLVGKNSNELPHESLSEQEFRVLLQLAQGLSLGQIAEHMHLSVKTVSTYRSRILEKLNLQSNASLARYCLSHGLVSS